MRLLAARSNFPVILISASVHVGKARMDNEAVGLQMPQTKQIADYEVLESY